MSRAHPRRRRGILLLVVLMVLVLFFAMFLTYIAVATQFRKTTFAFSRHEQTGNNPRKELDAAMYQLVRGTRNSQSKILGHDLLSDLYGFDGFQGAIATATYPGGTGGQFMDLAVDTMSPITDVLGNRVELDNGSGYYNGCVLSVVTRTTRPLSTRVVGYNGDSRVFRVMAFDNSQVTPARLAGARFVVNGRPFNGCGFGWNAATGSLDVMDDGRPVALLPDRSTAARNSVPWSIYVQGGPDESYDAPDFQNVFLALTTTNPSETEASSCVNPSFHRRALVNYWLEQTDGQLPDDLRRKIVLRPNRVDHPDFPRLESLVDGPWDVDNDGDGQRDSVWIDLGFPTQSTRDGRACKPLFAFHCVDLDGRLNLNAHGNLTSARILPEPDPVRLAEDVKTCDLQLPRGQGYGPAEISINGLFANPADHVSLLMGDPQRNLPGRYGLDRSIGGVGIDRSSVLKFFEYPENYLRTATMARRTTAFSSPHDLRGRTAMGLDERGDPVFEGLDETVVDNEYEINLSRGKSGGVNGAANDDLFSVAELERILRPFDVDADSLPQRLWQTLSTFRTGPMAAENRRAVTTDSFDLPVPSVLATRETRGLFRDSTFPRRRPLHVIDLLRARLIAGGYSGGDLDAEVAATLGPELAMGQRMDVNRPFGNARDDNGNGVVDEPSEAFHGEPLWPDVFRDVYFDHDNDGSTRGDGSAYLARHYFARHLYVLMMLLTDPDYLHPVHPSEASLSETDRRELSARRLAQWAVNVVDFRDADSIMTPFEYDANPFDGWQVDGEIDSVEVDSDRGVVWGCEYPHLLITETLAMHDTRLVDSDFDTGVGQKRILSDEEVADGETPDPDLDQSRIPQGSLFVELYCAGHRTTPPHNPAVPPELYRLLPDGTGKLDLGRMAPLAMDGTLCPVWRLAITASHLTEATSVRGQVATHPESCTLQPGALNLLDPTRNISIERIVWFSTGRPRADEQDKIFVASPGSLLAPGQYAIVGPRRRTFVPRSGDKKGGGLMISLDAGRFTIADPGSRPPHPLRAAVGIVAATQPPQQWKNKTITAPDGIGLSVSEPLPTSGKYYPEPKYRDASQMLPATDAYGLESANTAHKYYDTPWDNRPGTPLKADNLLGEGTRENYKTVFLQRLANPLVAFHPLTNPYITVDWMPIDLTVFNSQDKPPAGKLPEESRPFNNPDTIPGNIMFATRERGSPRQPGSVAADVWRAEHRQQLSHDENERRSPPQLRHTLGYLNRTYGIPRSTPAEHIGDPPLPIPWLTFNNRPFVSQYELMLVPCSSPQRLLTEHTTALPFNAYDPAVMGSPIQQLDSFRSPFGHLLNFFQSRPIPINDPIAPPEYSHSSHFFRLFEFTHVPSRFVATDTLLNPVKFADGDGTESFHPPFNRISHFRDPGRVNLNTISNGRVWDGVLNGHPGPGFEQLVDSRRGYIGVGLNALLDDVPTLIANPFRAGLAGDLVPLATMARADVECTLLRSDAIQRRQPPTGNPLFGNHSQHACNDTERNPYFRYEGIRYLGNLVTTHSNIFAVWITVGYFEVQPDTSVPINPDGYQLGQEIGSERGNIRRHRAFYIIDRTIPVGFELGVNHNVDDAVILRRFVE